MTPILAQRLGTDRSFERLYRKHAGDVYRYALVVLRNEADAEDVTQTTFLNAYRAFEQGERPRAPQNWLIAIAHNVCRQRFRQSQRRPNEVAFEEELAEATVVDDDALSAEDIRRALGHLAFNQRSALVMRELEGRSYQEIAEILDLSVSAVETLIFRARRALREQLEDAITCHEAEFAISRQLDGRLPRKERGALRAHLRECEECASFARSQRAQRGSLKSLAADSSPAVARRPLRRRGRGGGRRRHRGQGRGARRRRAARERRRLRRRQARDLEAAGGLTRRGRPSRAEARARCEAGRPQRRLGARAHAGSAPRPEALHAQGGKGPPPSTASGRAEAPP